MAATAFKKLEAGPLSVAGLQRLIDRLPAETRARLAWLPIELAASMSSFLDGPMDESSLRLLVRDLGRITTSFWPAMISVVEHPDLYRTELETAWRSDAGVLRTSLDPEVADTAEWTIRSWIALADLGLTLMGAESSFERASDARASLADLGLPLTGAEMEEVKRVLASAVAVDESVAEHGSPLRVQALIMAAIEGVRRGKPRAVIADLVLRAFDEMSTVMEYMQTAGLHVDPFKGETLAERAERARRYADHVRNALTHDDLQTLEASRLRRLR
ncbi:MAG TPA: hypothetical protein VN253_12395 [Kofleriaceae bacterium]|nr:hypothetical protein [Kofleriaceae bacterium]